MTATPLVSVIMPVYNAAGFVGAAIRSVKAQTCCDWELLAVDDASTDESRAIIEKEAADERIRLIRRSCNRGVAAARNTGLAEAQGRYVAFLDSDDLWEPSKLEEQLRCMQGAHVALCCTQYVHVDEDDNAIRILPAPPEDIDYDDLLKENPIGCSSVMLDRAQTGPVAFEPRGHEDYALWLSLLRRGLKAKGIAEPLMRHRVLGGSVSRNKLKAALWTWEIYREAERLPLPKAVACFIRYALRSMKKYTS
jgi:teichuronic acid biosynthesis glycosyltransferase TuaG